MNKLYLTSRKTIDILNAPINITAIVNSIFCNVRSVLKLENKRETNELDINQSLISDEELGLPANGIFSPKFSDILKDVLDKKL